MVMFWPIRMDHTLFHRWVMKNHIYFKQTQSGNLIITGKTRDERNT